MNNKTRNKTKAIVILAGAIASVGVALPATAQADPNVGGCVSLGSSDGNVTNITCPSQGGGSYTSTWCYRLSSPPYITTCGNTATYPLPGSVPTGNGW